jgi:hypothetical protein
MDMKKLQLTIIFFIIIQLKTSSQVQNYNELIKKLKIIELPFNINSFSDFILNKNNEVNLYNSITKKDIGYLDLNGKFHKATETYSNRSKIRIHERYVNGKYETYEAKDSSIVQFVGLVKLSKAYTCILVKIEAVPNDFQKAYYYKILSFDSQGKHLSTMLVYELIDDASIKDWIQEKPTPNVTSMFKNNGLIEIKWDEGNEMYIQYVELKDEGVFHVKKMEEKQRLQYK